MAEPPTAAPWAAGRVAQTPEEAQRLLQEKLARAKAMAPGGADGLAALLARGAWRVGACVSAFSVYVSVMESSLNFIWFFSYSIQYI